MPKKHVVVVRKFSAALVVLRRAALVESKQTDDAGLLKSGVGHLFPGSGNDQK